jgi:hypothetical protein
VLCSSLMTPACVLLHYCTSLLVAKSLFDFAVLPCHDKSTITVHEEITLVVQVLSSSWRWPSRPLRSSTTATVALLCPCRSTALATSSLHCSTALSSSAHAVCFCGGLVVRRSGRQCFLLAWPCLIMSMATPMMTMLACSVAVRCIPASLKFYFSSQVIQILVFCRC